MTPTSADEYRSLLASKVPEFDALLLKDYKPKIWYLTPLRRDVRLLPNNERRKWLIVAGFILRPKGIRYYRSWYKLNDKMEKRLKAWLGSLPKYTRRKERSMRMRRTGFVGKATTGKWSAGTGDSHTFDRITIKPPKTKNKWKPVKN